MTIDIRLWYEKYGPMVIRRCRGILRNEEEALDAAQDVFVNLLSAETRLHSRFPSSLLYTMATNVCLNRLRRGKILRIGNFSEAAEGKSRAAWEEELPFTDQGFDRVEGEVLLDLIFQDESQENRAMFFMYHADGMTLKEIGEAVGLSISGVRKRLGAFRKRARLRLGGSV
jgi:RNA polymerase sigma-70 factor (ECF subfamily)